MDPITEAQTRIQKALEHFKRELATVRAGRANPTLIEEISVPAYGGYLKLMEVGTITAPQPSLLTVQVWDGSLIKEVEKAIREANLGLNPATDGATVRVPIPPLTEERRVEFAKLAHSKGENAKIEIRQIRADMKDEIETAKESGDIGEDDMHRKLEKLQELVTQSGNQIDELVTQKQSELQQI